MKTCKLDSCEIEFETVYSRKVFCSKGCNDEFHRNTEATKKSKLAWLKSEEGKDYAKQWNSSAIGKASAIVSTVKWQKDNPEKYQAHILSRVLEDGMCSEEGCFLDGEKHHEDYSRPLDVVYLCKQHHIDRHKRMKL
jgi:hypothetical protein